MNINVTDKLKKYKVSVFQEDYFLLSDEPESHIIATSELVNKYIKEILITNPDIDINKVLVLVALQLSSKVLKSNEANQLYNDRCEDLINLINTECIQLNI